MCGDMSRGIDQCEVLVQVCVSVRIPRLLEFPETEAPDGARTAPSAPKSSCVLQSQANAARAKGPLVAAGSPEAPQWHRLVGQRASTADTLRAQCPTYQKCPNSSNSGNSADSANSATVAHRTQPYQPAQPTQRSQRNHGTQPNSGNSGNLANSDNSDTRPTQPSQPSQATRPTQRSQRIQPTQPTQPTR